MDSRQALLESRELSLKLLKAAAKRRKEANSDYHEAFIECVEAGVSNTKMAEAVGVSETAIRLYKKRKGL